MSKVDPIVVLSDAHLLIQAEWVEDERRRTQEGEEALENFRRALARVKKAKPNAVLLAGDMFDYQTVGRHKVAHREGEKYMADIRDILESLADNCGCKIYALKGNHDSEPVLRSIERALRGKFVFVDNEAVNIGGLTVYFMRTHYEAGDYDIAKLPDGGDVLLMHEQIRTRPGMPGLPDETLQKLGARYKLVLNGHMHVFKRGTLGIPNLVQVPALIPSREIKEGWIYKLTWNTETRRIEFNKRLSPFGFITVKDTKVDFRRYAPTNKVVHVEVRGQKAGDFVEGVREAYEHLIELPDKDHLRVWVKTDADSVVIKRLLWPEVRRYRDELYTVDILPLPRGLIVQREEPRLPTMEGKAFTRDELIEMILSSLSGRAKEVAKKIFEGLLTTELLRREKHNKLNEFMDAVRIVAEEFKLEVSDAFFERVRELARSR